MLTVVIVHELFLFHSLSNVLNGISTPNLSFFYDSTRRYNTVGGYNGSLLKDSSFHDDGVVSHIDSSINGTRIKSAVILDNIVSHQVKFCSETSGRRCCCMENTVIADTNVFGQAVFDILYTILLISPLITVPCHIATLEPRKTSPMILALGATKTYPSLQTSRS